MALLQIQKSLESVPSIEILNLKCCEKKDSLQLYSIGITLSSVYLCRVVTLSMQEIYTIFFSLKMFMI